MITLYVKKIVSLNPKRYEYIELKKATHHYQQYVSMCLYHNKNCKTILKTFKEWLTTEI